MNKKNNVITLICFFAYYFVLLCERLYSFISSATDKEIGLSGMLVSGGNFERCIWIMALGSIAVFVVYFLFVLGKIISVGANGSFKPMCVAAGILLVSGMADTPHSLTIVQFIAYIALLIGCLVRYIQIGNYNDRKKSCFSQFAYLVCFSMAIPVVHKLEETPASGGAAIYVLETGATLLLILMYTFMLCWLFGDEKYERINNPIIFIVMLLLDGAIIFVTNKYNSANWFVAVAAVLAFVTYIIARVFMKQDKRPIIL